MATKFRFNYNNQTVDFEDYYVRADFFRQGNLWTWGVNSEGQLGDNTITHRSSPVQTIAFGNNWNNCDSSDGWIGSIDTRVLFNAGVKSNGTLWSWGGNGYGQLGDNTITHRSSPVQTVTAGTNWKQVSCGDRTTAAIKTDGTLWLWGYNDSGNIGDNTNISRSSPVQTVTAGTNWKQVSCGNQTTGAIKTDGTLWLWGLGNAGQLGTNNIFVSSPVQTVTAGTNWDKVACGYSHTAAIKTDGSLWLWGYNANGSLGDNTFTTRSSPVQTVTAGTNWKQVSCGYDHTAAIKTDGTLWLWGGNGYGQLGDNTLANKSSPVQTVTGGTNWKAVSCGTYSTAAIKTDGTLWLWGRNNYGQVGNNTTINRSSPVQTVLGGTSWRQVSCGYLQAVAVTYLDDIYVPTSSTAPSGTVAPTATASPATPTPTPSGTPPAATPTPSATPSATGAPGPTQQFEP